MLLEDFHQLDGHLDQIFATFLKYFLPLFPRASLVFPFSCFTDLICISDNVSLQAEQKKFLFVTVKCSLGYCFICTLGVIILGSSAVLVLLFFAPIGGGLRAILHFLDNSEEVGDEACPIVRLLVPHWCPEWTHC